MIDKDISPDLLRKLYELARAGVNLSNNEAAGMEKVVAHDPLNLDLRIKLLGYYSSERFSSSSPNPKRIAHINWLIDNQPTLEILSSYAEVSSDIDGRLAYADVREHWLHRLGKDENNPIVLLNAARFFIHDDKETAERCLLRARELEPTNARWPHELSKLYSLWGVYYEAQALRECEAAIQLRAHPIDRFHDLTRLPGLAFAAGKLDKASQTSWKLIEVATTFSDDWNYGNAINEAHTVLGRIALKAGDRIKAKQHLSDSVVNAVSPQIQSFGPNLELAAELLEYGETSAVLKYFDTAAGLWSRGQGRLEAWRTMIEEGKSPFSNLFGERRKFLDLVTKPRALYNSKRWEESKESALHLLDLAQHYSDDERYYGYAVHVAHVVLGQLAMSDGDLSTAKDHLSRAGRVPASKRLFDQGPDLNLADALGRCGEQAMVLEFLTSLKELWEDKSHSTFDKWIERASQGMPIAG